MIKCLIPDTSIRIDVDPNPNGLPVLILDILFKDVMKYGSMLDKEQVEELIKELQNRLTEM